MIIGTAINGFIDRDGVKHPVSGGGSPIDISGKADKVENATDGNFASLDEEGNLMDSGKKASDFAAASHDHAGISSLNGGEVYADNNKVYIGVLDAEEDDDIVEINNSNIANLRRALATPSSIPEDDATKLITSKAVSDALAGKMGTLKEIFIDCDDSGTSDGWEIRPDADGEAAFRGALVWGDNAPRLVIVNIRKGTFGTTNIKTYRTIGSIHATAVEVNVETYDLTAEIYVDGHVFTRTGEEQSQETTWDQGLTLASNDIFTHTSNL